MEARLKRYDDPNLLYERVAPHLIEHEAENNLILGILANIRAGRYENPYMAVVERAGEINQVILCTPPHPVLLSYRSDPPPPEDVGVAVEDLRPEVGDEVGFTGNKRVVEAYVVGWERLTGRRGRRTMAMRIFKLTRVNPVAGVPGKMRHVGEADRELVTGWMRAFNQEALQEEVPLDKAQALVDWYLSGDSTERGMVLWEAGGTPVSLAGYSGPTPHGIRVNAVYTPPDQRRRGYAGACVAALSRYLLNQGYRYCFLFTDLSNPTSNHIYQKIGYEAVTDVDTYRFS